MQPRLRVLFLAAEADPFIKIGGLGDVAGSLPHALRALYTNQRSAITTPPIDVRLVIPFHGAIERQNYPLQKVASFFIPYKDRPVQAEVLSMEWDGLPVYFIAGRLIPPDAPVYTPNPAEDGIKFTFFSLAALELVRALEWPPNIIHANDWHTAPALYAVSRQRREDPFFSQTRLVLGLHNLPYLGIGAGPALSAFGLPAVADATLPEWAQHLPLPLGLWSADRIVAVSPTYAKEILTPEFSSGLEIFLGYRQEAITGILNGIDTNIWDPQNDPALPRNYCPGCPEERSVNKLSLLHEFGLREDLDTPLFAMVTRMDIQKGIDLVPAAMHLISDKAWQALILGTGDPAIENAVRRLERTYPDRVRAALRFDSDLSHRIYGGADALLIPSRYEPSGLTQMIAMRYGCIPIARSTGGLRDTIQDFRPDEPGTGFLFYHPTPAALANALRRALHIYHRPVLWRQMQVNGMHQDFSWEHSAKLYLSLYQSLLAAKIPAFTSQTLKQPGEIEL